ncbi:L-glutamine--2-deoxy-scyllo-inosose aminotransferase KanB [Terrimonas sp.]|uniref:DegT/DnrJ/EryC1/StrS family aminotransferase n=1 Tax=Terrimonas sp. TaxID=1914338 RepID=UPI000D51CA6D|nr:aminotransferase class I/II-fold pyridoxal phosphate-dependent enzyme [Terrimonas sp.]PVD52965.1 L-glutamine--2-deoxy-scyllo-inosose aminotransferase KanB [Terrimonas sp.]
MPGTELFGKEEQKEIDDVMRTGILFRYNHDQLRAGIWKAKAFEAEVKNLTGARYAHAVSSGSAAVSAALASCGIGAGDEVIVPPFTYVATIEAVLLAGALPVFAEIDETLCLSAAGIEKALSPRTKAVCLVHMCGGMADMVSIMPLIQKHNLILVEDAGQAFGASYKGISVGLFGKAGCYSFDFFKIATAGEGGVLVTNEEKIYKLADAYCDHGHDHKGNNRGMEQHPVIGFNYRISELHAAIGTAQTRRVPEIIQRNRINKSLLTNLLSDLPDIAFSKLPDPDGDSATFLNLLLPDIPKAKATADQFDKAGLSGFNYWYINMYHFINQWNHIKQLKTAARLPIAITGTPQDYQNLALPKSQQVIGRLISFSIRCTWSREEIEHLADGIKYCMLNSLPG